MQSPRNPPFWDLSPELRRLCYILLFVQHRQKLHLDSPPWVSRFNDDLAREYPSLLLISKEIRADAESVYFAFAHLRIPSSFIPRPKSGKRNAAELR